MLADDRCRAEEPSLEAVGEAHAARCYYHERAHELPREEAADLALPAVDRIRAAAAPVRRSRQGLPPARLGHPRARRRQRRRSGRARRSGSSASPAAARRRSRAPCSGSSARARARSSSRRSRSHPATRSARGDDLRSIQIVFQNPDSALNRRHSVRRILLRSMRKLAGIKGEAAEARLTQLTGAVRLVGAYADAEAGAALGRPEAARRDRARVRRRSQARRLRRADLGPRRLRAGGDPQPARRAAGRQGRVLHLHLPRSRRRPLHLRSDRGALPRPDHGARAGRTSSSTGRTIRTRRRSSRRCRRSTAAGASGSGSRATSRAPPSRRRAASSTRAARAGSAPICDETEPPLVEVEHGSPDALPHPDRRATCPAASGGDGRDDVKIRAAVLEEDGGRQHGAGARPRPARARRGARAPRCERGLPLGLQRGRRHDRLAVPRRARARGRGRRRGRRRRRHPRRARRSRRALVDAVLRRVLGVRARPAAALRDRVAGDERRRPDGRDEPALAGRRARLPLLLPLDLRRGVRRPRALVRADPGRRPLRRRGPRRLRGHDRRRRGLEDGRASGRATASR